jgi:hypothetical protein
MITICLTYFKSLMLAHLAAALYSISRQDLTNVSEVVVVDNDTRDPVDDIQVVIDAYLSKVVAARLCSFKHGDPERTHAWSTNVAVRQAMTPWVLFTRADYLLSFDLVRLFAEQAEGNRFVTSRGCHVYADIAECERTAWRALGPRFDGSVYDYSLIDAGVWMARKDAFEKVEGLNEGLTAWGHAQTDFQYRLHKSGVQSVLLPHTLFYHPQHAADRDMALANKQLRDQGIDLKELWARHDGVNPYR